MAAVLEKIAAIALFMAIVFDKMFVILSLKKIVLLRL